MDWTRFDTELRERMNVPDETDEEFLARMTRAKQNEKRISLSKRARSGSDATEGHTPQMTAIASKRPKAVHEHARQSPESSRSTCNTAQADTSKTPLEFLVPELRSSSKRASSDADFNPKMKRIRHVYEEDPCQFHATSSHLDPKGSHGSPESDHQAVHIPSLSPHNSTNVAAAIPLTAPVLLSTGTGQLQMSAREDGSAQLTGESGVAQCEKIEPSGPLAGRARGRSGEASKLALSPPHVEQWQASASATTRVAPKSPSQEPGKRSPKPAITSELPATPKGQTGKKSGPDTSVLHRPAVDQSYVTTPGGNTTTPGAYMRALYNDDKGVGTSKGGKRKGTSSKEPKTVPLKKQPVKLQKLPSMLPSEFLQYIQEEYRSGRRKYSANNFLAGKVLYYYAANAGNATMSTKERTDLLVRYGATVLPEFDNNKVTQIVVADHASLRGLLRTCGVKRLDDIRGDIPILKWGWLCEGVRPKNGTIGTCGYYHKYAAFNDRVLCDPAMEAPLRKAQEMRAAAEEKNKGKKQYSDHDSESEEEYSKISEFTEDKILPPPKQPFATDDPLAEFYDQARAELRAEREFEDVSHLPASGKAASGSKRGFLCDTRGPVVRGACPNEDIIERLVELRDLHKVKMSKEDQWRVLTYNRAIPAIRAHPKRITSFKEAVAIQGVGEKTAKKIMEIVETGGLRRIAYERTPEVTAMKIFMGIYDVGKATAYKWYMSGCRTLEDVKAGKGGVELHSAQKIGLEHYDDINDRMPRDEARTIFDMIERIALRLDPKLSIDIMGSYRRGKADCGDIDILITRPTNDGRTHRGILRRLLDESRKHGIITEDLSIPKDLDELELVYRGLCRKDTNSRRRRIDFLTVPYESRGAALLYYTGNDIFNRSMRLKASKMGYSLNQRGLYHGVIRNPSHRQEKLERGQILASETEQEIFKILGIPWQEPCEREKSAT